MGEVRAQMKLRFPVIQRLPISDILALRPVFPGVDGRMLVEEQISVTI
jgi:hypothetical protein